jgi:hypothetical protein
MSSLEISLKINGEEKTIKEIQQLIEWNEKIEQVEIKITSTYGLSDHKVLACNEVASGIRDIIEKYLDPLVDITSDVVSQFALNEILFLSRQ